MFFKSSLGEHGYYPEDSPRTSANLLFGMYHHSTFHMEYLRIYSETSDRGKHWYVIKSSFCKPCKFLQRVIFNYFPEEITKTPASQLTTEDGRNLLSVRWFHKNQKATPDMKVYVIT